MSKSSSFPIMAALVAVLGGLGILILLNQSPASTSATVPGPSIANGSLTLSETSWDWGDISMALGMATRDVTFENTSGEPVTLTAMSTSCMCTTVSLIRANGSMVGPKGMVGHGGSPSVNETIQPGETGVLRVVFDPNAHGPAAVGPIRRGVTLATSSTNQPQIELTFSGNVVK